MKKVFLTGSSGQLGSELKRILLDNIDKYEFIAPLRSELDLVDLDSVLKMISRVKPDIIIHSAAYTNVVQAEIYKENCYLDNVVATSNLVNACKLVNAVFVYVSTDFVFDGKLSRPYKTTDSTNPLNYYGECKLIAEKHIQFSLSKYFIVRTSWLFSHNEGNFLTKILAAAKEKNEISVIYDEIGSPTSTLFLSRVILSLIENNDFGLYHVSNQGICSRYDFASTIVKLAEISCAVKPLDSNFNSEVKRPKYSVLENNWVMDAEKHQSWKEALSEVLNQFNKNSQNG